jgi:hypothetical protein
VLATGSGVLALALGCAPEPSGIRKLPGFGADAEEGEPLAYAVMASDRTVTTIALLRPDGRLLVSDLVNSGSAPAGLSTALSGDVALPTRSGERSRLVLIDRFRTDVVTRIDVAAGEVLSQVRVHAATAEREGRAYSGNPQDYVYLAAHSAWVSRYNPNLSVAPDDADAGNDLIEIDVAEAELTGRRIDLSALDTSAERRNPDTGETEEARAYARPGRMVRIGDQLVVGLSRLSAGFDAIGDGMVALVDVERGVVRGLSIPGLRNCSQVVPVPGAPERVAVACTGLLRGSFGEGAGLAVLELAGDELQVVHVLPAQQGAPIAVFGLVALGDSVVVAAEPGRAPGPGSGQDSRGDRLYRVDLASGEQQLLFESADSFAIGDGSYDAHARVLLVPDASVDADGRPSAGVRRFAVAEDGAIEDLETTTVDDTLPPWQVMPL